MRWEAREKQQGLAATCVGIFRGEGPSTNRRHKGSWEVVQSRSSKLPNHVPVTRSARSRACLREGSTFVGRGWVVTEEREGCSASSQALRSTAPQLHSSTAPQLHSSAHLDKSSSSDFRCWTTYPRSMYHMLWPRLPNASLHHT